MIGNGCVIAIGGNEDKRARRESILASFVERAGGATARIVIVPSASVEPDERAAQYAEIFGRFGAGSIRSVHAERAQLSGSDRTAIRQATGIFVTGGDQVALMAHLRRHDLVDLIRETVRDGAVYAGTSAGASAVSRRMIAGTTDEHGNESIAIHEGLGLIPDVIVDQHFGERQRLPRLVVAARKENLRGVGIDENTAMIWTADGATLVHGTGEVTVVDPEHQLDATTMPHRIRILRSSRKRR
jgi:cyanophycinase